MPNHGMYPAFLVKRYGIEKIRKIMAPSVKTDYKSRVRPLQDKISAFIEKHKKFTAGMCAKYSQPAKLKFYHFYNQELIENVIRMEYTLKYLAKDL